MKKIILFLNFILLLLPAAIFGQEKIQSKLTDSKGKVIPYASVAITGTSLGTISNLNGNFELALPDNKSNLTISISCIGYQTKVCTVDSILQIQKQGKLPNLLLTQQHYQLQEVVVGKQEILKDAKQIFTKAIQELPNLLDDQPHIGKYYFRQSHRDDSTMNRLIEAAVSIYDPGSKQSIKECKFNVDQIHSSLDNRILPHELNLSYYRRYALSKSSNRSGMRIDSRIPEPQGRNKPDTIWKNPKIQKYLTNVFDNHYASLPDFFCKTNMIRDVRSGRRKKSLRINPKFKNGAPKITDSFLKEHILKLDTILSYNNEMVYKIKILPNKKYPGLKSQKSRFIPIGCAYIRISDFAFLGLDYAYISNPKYKGVKYNGQFIRKYNGKAYYYFKFQIRYKEFNGKLYTNYLYYKRNDYNNIPFANLFPTEFSEYLKIPVMHGRQLCIQEMINTKIITDTNTIQTEYTQRNWKGDHYEKLPYHKDFWDKYTTMLPTLEQENLKKNLQQELLKK